MKKDFESGKFELMKMKGQDHIVDGSTGLDIRIIYDNEIDDWEPQDKEIHFYVIHPKESMIFETVNYQGQNELEVKKAVRWFLCSIGKSGATISSDLEVFDEYKLLEFYNIDTAEQIGCFSISRHASEEETESRAEEFKQKFAESRGIDPEKVEYIEIPIELI